MKPKKRERQSRTLLFTSFLIITLLGFNTFTTYNSMQTIKQNKVDDEWNYINSILTENQEKAIIQTNYLKEDIKKDISFTYSDKEKLKEDMDNLDVNSNLSKILNNNLQGKYLNVNSDNNDLFVLSTWQESDSIDLKGRVIYDKSVNCASGGEMRDFSRELSMHSNYNLGYDALHRILTQDKEKPIFWEYLKSNNSNHEELQYCSLEGLKEIYTTEGIEGLKTYEILVPVYIDDSNDLLGNDKVSNNGVLNQDNRQIVLVQGFSLYDVVMQSHRTSLLLEDKNYETQVRNTQLYSIFSNILMLIIFFAITKVTNLVVELEDLGDESKEKQNTEE